MESDDFKQGSKDSSKDEFPSTQGFEFDSPADESDGSNSPATSPFGRIGPYHLIRTLGEGGMGTVWLAEQTEPIRRLVALKTIKSGKQNHKQIIGRFEAERQALAMMEHRNIAKVFDAGISAKHGPYFVMEYCNGLHINRFCAKHKLNLKQRLQLFLQVCNGVQHAHQKGLIHRDLKPSNILVVRQEKKVIPKIIDFGLVKAIRPELRLTDKTIFSQVLVGTFKYMSPEQVGPNATDVDTRADIFALGTILYELLTGSTPIEDESIQKKAIDEIIRVIREDEPPRPSMRLADSGTDWGIAGSDSQSWKSPLRNELDWIVMRALDKNRERRYGTAAAFADDIKHYLSGDAVDARPPSKVYQLRKFIYRNKGLVATVSVIAATLVLSLIAISWSAWQAKNALAKANVETVRAVAAESRARQKEKQEDAALARSNYINAGSHWSNNDAREANRYLEMVPESEEYRDFEWHLSKRQFSGSSTTFFGHQGWIGSVAYSPDGKFLSSGSGDRSIKIWNAQSGSLVRTFEYAAIVRSVCFSPDGKYLVSGSDDGLVKIWDVKKGIELRTFLGHTGRVKCVCFSPNGKRVASASDDKTIRIWSVKSGALLESLTGHTAAVESVDFSPDGKRLASVTFFGDSSIKIWDAQNGSLLKTLSSSGDFFRGVKFSPDGDRLATAGGNGRDGMVSIWNPALGTKLKSFRGHETTARAVAFSPSGAVLASASEDKNLKLWNVRTGEELRTLVGHIDHVNSVAFNPTGAHLATGSSDKTVRQWDVRDGPHLISLENHAKAITTVAISKNCEALATASSDQTIKLWNLQNGSLLKSLAGHHDTVSGLAFSSDGKRLATASSDQTIKLWDTQSGILEKTLARNTGPISSIAFSPDGNLLATASVDDTVSLWEVQTGLESKLRTRGKKICSVASVAFNPDGTRMATCSPSSPVAIWDVRSRKLLKKIEFSDRAFSFLCVAFNRDGTRLAVGFLDGYVAVVDTHDWRELNRIEAHSGVVHSVVFSPNGKRMATAGADHLIKLWDAETGAELKRLAGHTDDVSSIAFNSNGTRLASGSWDGTAKLWLAPHRSEVKRFSGHKTRIAYLSFSRDDTRVYCQDDRGKTTTLDLQTGKELENAEWEKLAVHRRTSADQRWFLTSQGNDVLIVDREYKNVAEEKALREFRTRSEPFWHEQQAIQSLSYADWFATTFHWAWALKLKPNCSEYYRKFHSSYKKLLSGYAIPKEEVSEQLPVIFREALRIARPE